jgi:hypothetical protein
MGNPSTGVAEASALYLLYRLAASGKITGAGALGGFRSFPTTTYHAPVAQLDDRPAVEGLPSFSGGQGHARDQRHMESGPSDADTRARTR